MMMMMMMMMKETKEDEDEDELAFSASHDLSNELGALGKQDNCEIKRLISEIMPWDFDQHSLGGMPPAPHCTLQRQPL